MDSGSATAIIPGHPFSGPGAVRDAFAHLRRYHGVDPYIASNRLHLLKESGGLGPADDVVIGRTGDVYDASSGIVIGSLTDRRLGAER